jgi:hypothetical protein
MNGKEQELLWEKVKEKTKTNFSTSFPSETPPKA